VDLDLRENDQVHERNQHVLPHERLERARAAVQNIEILDPGFEFSHGPRCVLRPRSGNDLQLNTEPFFESLFEFLPEHAGGRAADNNLAFFLGGFDNFLPILRRLGRAGQVSDDEERCERQSDPKAR